MYSESMNSNMLKGKIIENGFTQKDVAEKLGISVQAFNAKINKREPISLDEAAKLVEILKVQDIYSIFFNHMVANKQQNNI